MGVLLFRGMFRTKEIEANGSKVNDDILRCCVFLLFALRSPAGKHAENSATHKPQAPRLRYSETRGSMRVMCQEIGESTYTKKFCVAC